MSMSDTSHYKL